MDTIAVLIYSSQQSHMDVWHIKEICQRKWAVGNYCTVSVLMVLSNVEQYIFHQIWSHTYIINWSHNYTYVGTSQNSSDILTLFHNFSSDIKHVNSPDNYVADALSHIEL